MSDVIHMVCFDAPSPPDYGGAIDLYYKVQALAKAGKKIILHYFSYKEGRSAAGLESYCQEIHAWKRGSFWNSLVKRQPYIVSSRINAQMIERINADDHPVLMEGIHCSGILPLLKPEKKVVLRLANDEAIYYTQLFLTEKNVLRKIYFQREYRLLSTYQLRLPENLPIAALSSEDAERFHKKYGFTNVKFLPCFSPWQEVKSLTGKGSYCLYHGNLSVPENRQAAIWLAKKVFSGLDHELVIAGKQASGLKKLLHGKGRLRIVENPSDQELTALIREAHINVLPSLNRTGVKFKLLHALFEGRFCLTNLAGVAGSGLDSAVVLAEDVDSIRNEINRLMASEFTENEIHLRKNLLHLYNNEKNARELSALL